MSELTHPRFRHTLETLADVPHASAEHERAAWYCKNRVAERADEPASAGGYRAPVLLAEPEVSGESIAAADRGLTTPEQAAQPAQNFRIMVVGALSLALMIGVLMAVLFGCSAPPALSTTASRGSSRPVAATPPPADPGATSSAIARSTATPTPQTASGDRPAPAACRAPSLTIRGPADARDAAALAACQFRPTGHDAIGSRCGQPGHEHGVALDRLDEAVLPLDPRTADHVRAIAAVGHEEERNPHAFGLVGDSITASPKFMTPFTDARHVTLGDDVAARLAVEGHEGTIVDRYRGRDAGVGVDSFVAPRAAKVGAKSSWALHRTPSPLDRMIGELSPAVAIVMYGSNDAAVRYGDLDELVADYREHMAAIVDRLEAEGIVPVLTTVPRHTLDPTRPHCDRKQGDGSNWRIAVQTSAVSAAAAGLACERALPLVDLRWAFDALLNHGIGPDGVHPNGHRGGAGKLDAEGLQCGYNVRNYVTLRMLARVWPLIRGPQAHP